MPLLTISSPGYYAVTADYTATGAADNAVEVLPGVHNVVILLYGRLISPLFSTAQQNCGINFNGSNSCQVIGMGGHIRGFGYGLRAENCDDLGVSQVYVKDALMRGVRISGDDAYVKDCRVANVHGSTFLPDQYCFGIEVDGARPTITGNSVREFWGTAAGEGVGISITDNAAAAVTAFNIVANASLRAKTFGFWMGGASDIDFVHNHAARMVTGAAASSPTMGLCDENSFRDCTTDFIDSGNDWIIGGMDG